MITPEEQAELDALERELVACSLANHAPAADTLRRLFVLRDKRYREPRTSSDELDALNARRINVRTTSPRKIADWQAEAQRLRAELDKTLADVERLRQRCDELVEELRQTRAEHTADASTAPVQTQEPYAACRDLIAQSWRQFAKRAKMHAGLCDGPVSNVMHRLADSADDIADEVGGK